MLRLMRGWAPGARLFKHTYAGGHNWWKKSWLQLLPAKECGFTSPMVRFAVCPQSEAKASKLKILMLLFGEQTSDLQRCTQIICDARYVFRRARHSSAVISQISVRKRPETYSCSSIATTRMPCFSEMRRDGVLSTALGIRMSGNMRTSNQ